MNIVIIIGDHLRHTYFASEIHKIYNLKGLIIESREEMIPDTPKILIKNDLKNYKKHFKNRIFYELKYFKNADLPETEKLKIKSLKKNFTKVKNFINRTKPKLVLLFGVSVLDQNLLNIMPSNIINLHAGLAPYYRGSACNFWPFYFLSPHHSGYTYHKVEKIVDNGNVIHHSVPKLKKGLSIHEVNCLGLIQAIKDFKKIINYFKKYFLIPSYKINNQGKFFFNSDFQPEHLRLIYNIFNDKIVDYYLDHKKYSKKIKLIKI